VYEGAYVDPVEAHSNLPDHVERLRSLLDLPEAASPRGRVKRLATKFGIHRDTVHNILIREGALRPRGIQPNDLPEAIRLYEAGWSLARLAAEFDVSPSTVNRALLRAGIPIRRTGLPRGPSAT
jgi:lambda repressor-like predicted transcriptional regulator